MKLRVHLAVTDGAVRRRLAAALRADPDVVVVGEAGEADLVVTERVTTTSSEAPALASDAGASLTARERAVLRLMAQGLGNKEIAGDLDISRHTVKFHVASVLAKLGARSRAEAVSLGLKRGLLPL